MIERDIYPKDFLKGTIRQGIADVIKVSPFLGFTLITIGIEFVGKCIHTRVKDWHSFKPEHKAFDKGLERMIMVDSRYGNLKLKQLLRNGCAHTLIPKMGIGLSERRLNEPHLEKDINGNFVLVLEDYYEDFCQICQGVLETTFPVNDKMNKPILKVTK